MEGDRSCYGNRASGNGFQSTPSAWRETCDIAPCVFKSAVFQSTPSAWRETSIWVMPNSMPHISIHSLRMEGDPDSAAIRSQTGHFNPLPPHGGRLVCIPNRCQCGDISIHSLRMEGDSAVSSAAVPVSPFQSTPSAWRETPGVADIAAQCQISIHSLRMEGDRISSSHRKTVLHFNPLPPHGGRPRSQGLRLMSDHFNPLPPHGGRLVTAHVIHYIDAFQSTPSAWRETRQGSFPERHAVYFNPLPPHGGRHRSLVCVLNAKHFNPLPPHTPISVLLLHFNPLPPHGGRQLDCLMLQYFVRFQSTPSAWRETCRSGIIYSGVIISIHSLRMEGDRIQRRTTETE